MRTPLPYVITGREPSAIEWDGAKQATRVYMGCGLSIDTYHWLVYLTTVWGYDRTLLLLRSFCVPEHCGEAGVSAESGLGLGTPTVVPGNASRDTAWRNFLCSPALGVVLAGGSLVGGNAAARAVFTALSMLRAYTCGGQAPANGAEPSQIQNGVCQLVRAHPVAAQALGTLGGTLLAACNLASDAPDTQNPQLPSPSALPGLPSGLPNPLGLPGGATPSGIPSSVQDILRQGGGGPDIVRAMQEMASSLASQRARSYRSVPQLAEALGRLTALGYPAEDAVDNALASALITNADELLYAVMAQSFLDAGSFGELASRVAMRPLAQISGLSQADANQPATEDARNAALAGLKGLFIDEPGSVASVADPFRDALPSDPFQGNDGATGAEGGW